MCLFCMLQCSPDIERRLCSLLDNKTLPLIIYKLLPSLSLFYYEQFIILNCLDKTQRLKYEIKQQQQQQYTTTTTTVKLIQKFTLVPMTWIASYNHHIVTPETVQGVGHEPWNRTTLDKGKLE